MAKRNTCAVRYRRTPSTHFASNYVHAFPLATLTPPSTHVATHTRPMATQSGCLFECRGGQCFTRVASNVDVGVFRVPSRH